MMRSLYAGVSGLRTHQTKMDVIGNNIANVNTVAFKSSTVTFGELMYQTTQSASGPNAATGIGGINAKQIGLGVSAAAINASVAQPGSDQSTGNPFDVKISGDNFFVVSDGSNNLFTRAGAFYVDAAGNLAMTSNGYNVMGWGVSSEDPNAIQSDTVQELRIMSPENMTYPPEATTDAYVSGIIDKNDTDVNSDEGMMMNLKIYDNLGYNYTAKLCIKATSETKSTGEYSVELVDLLDAKEESVLELYGPIELGTNQEIKDEGELVLKGITDATDLNTFAFNGGTVDLTTGFDVTNTELMDAVATQLYGLESGDELLNMQVSDGTDIKTIRDLAPGNILELHTSGDVSGVAGTIADKIVTVGREFQGCVIGFDTTTGVFKSMNNDNASTTITLGFPDTFAQFSDVEIDFSKTSMYHNGGESTVGATNGNVDSPSKGSGRRLGKLSGISIQQNGMILASYDNGQNRLLGQIATALFANPSGLEKQGENLYAATLNSGEFDGIGVDVSANGGSMKTGTLEMSNVDLSQEFADMITTQRGFQANSRIITTSDTMLEELINIKR